jgi:hypothetical protein
MHTVTCRDAVPTILAIRRLRACCVKDIFVFKPDGVDKGFTELRVFVLTEILMNWVYVLSPTYVFCRVRIATRLLTNI